MKPAPFEYHDPTTLDQVLTLLARHGDEAKLLAGGQSLVPMLNMRLARPTVLIDLNRVDGLAYIREEAGVLAIGAMTRHAEIEESALVAARQPLLAEAMRQVGHIQIRNRGTIGGSLAHADPSAELPAVMLALDASLVAAGPSGRRDIAAVDFFIMYYTTALEPGELVVEVRVPVAAPTGYGWSFEEVARRHGDFALAGVACALTVDSAGRVAECGLGLTGVGMTPVRAGGAEGLVCGRSGGPVVWAAAGDAVRNAVEPESDVHATAEYRRQLAGVLTHRALARAYERACGGRAVAPKGGGGA